MSTWVLAAHRAGARIFAHEAGELHLLRSIEHPTGRVKDNDLEPGPRRGFDSHAQGRHAKDRGRSPHEQDAVSFARDLAKLLEEGRSSMGVKRIVLVAESHFLGLLRAELGSELHLLVSASVPKDLHAVAAAHVLNHLEGVLPGPRKSS